MLLGPAASAGRTAPRICSKGRRAPVCSGGLPRDPTAVQGGRRARPHAGASTLAPAPAAHCPAPTPTSQAAAPPPPPVRRLRRSFGGSGWTPLRPSASARRRRTPLAARLPRGGRGPSARSPSSGGPWTWRPRLPGGTFSRRVGPSQTPRPSSPRRSPTRPSLRGGGAAQRDASVIAVRRALSAGAGALCDGGAREGAPRVLRLVRGARRPVAVLRRGAADAARGASGLADTRARAATQKRTGVIFSVFPVPIPGGAARCDAAGDRPVSVHPRGRPQVLADFPSVQPPLAWLLQVAPRLRPRHYSVASSPREAPGSARLLVAVATWRTPMNRQRTGLCSGLLADASVGSHWAVWVAPGAHLATPSAAVYSALILSPGGRSGGAICMTPCGSRPVRPQARCGFPRTRPSPSSSSGRAPASRLCGACSRHAPGPVCVIFPQAPTIPRGSETAPKTSARLDARRRGRSKPRRRAARRGPRCCSSAAGAGPRTVSSRTSGRRAPAPVDPAAAAVNRVPVLRFKCARRGTERRRAAVSFRRSSPGQTARWTRRGVEGWPTPSAATSRRRRGAAAAPCNTVVVCSHRDTRPLARRALPSLCARLRGGAGLRAARHREERGAGLGLAAGGRGRRRRRLREEDARRRRRGVPGAAPLPLRPLLSAAAGGSLLLRARSEDGKQEGSGRAWLPAARSAGGRQDRRGNGGGRRAGVDAAAGGVEALHCGVLGLRDELGAERKSRRRLFRPSDAHRSGARTQAPAAVLLAFVGSGNN